MLSPHNLKVILISAAIGFVVLMPGTVFGLLYEIVHALFEVLEELFDFIIEHLLGTGTHETQIIVFYLLLALIFYGVYKLWCLSLSRYILFKLTWDRWKSEALLYWQQASLPRKTGIVAISLAVISFLIFWYTL